MYGSDLDQSCMDLCYMGEPAREETAAWNVLATVFVMRKIGGRLLSVCVRDLTDKLGPAHVHSRVDFAGLRSRVVL